MTKFEPFKPNSSLTTPVSSEGLAKFNIGEAFYRPESRRIRDLGILAAAIYHRQKGQLRVLDVMTGCGVRALRYVLEAKANWVWANEGNPSLIPLIQGNLKRCLSANRYQLTSQSAQNLLANCLGQGERFDLVDIDCFGSPLPHLTMGIAITRLDGLLFLTATDGKSLAGHDSDRALTQFNAYTRCHPAVHEQALRVILGAVHQMAQFQGLGMQPIFSFFCGKTYRIMVRITRRRSNSAQNYGFLGYCHNCGEFQPLSWRSLNRAHCNCTQTSHHCSSSSSTTSTGKKTLPENIPLAISGPLWLGPLHDLVMVTAMRSLALDWGWSSQATLLHQMSLELQLPPFYYPLAEIGRRGHMDIPNRDRLIEALQKAGYTACRASITAQAIKTNASLATAIQIAKQVNGWRLNRKP